MSEAGEFPFAGYGEWNPPRFVSCRSIAYFLEARTMVQESGRIVSSVHPIVFIQFVTVASVVTFCT